MKQFENKKRIVIKVGSSTLAYPTGHLNLRKCQHLIEVMSDIKNSGREVVFGDFRRTGSRSRAGWSPMQAYGYSG